MRQAGLLCKFEQRIRERKDAAVLVEQKERPLPQDRLCCVLPSHRPPWLCTARAQPLRLLARPRRSAPCCARSGAPAAAAAGGFPAGPGSEAVGCPLPHPVVLSPFHPAICQPSRPQQQRQCAGGWCGHRTGRGGTDGRGAAAAGGHVGRCQVRAGLARCWLGGWEHV